jgi:hypothetical protein
VASLSLVIRAGNVEAGTERRLVMFLISAGNLSTKALSHSH